MKLSTKGRYAVIAMIELALHDDQGLLPLGELTLSQDISISYLEQLFAKLRSAGLVTGVRGPRGGYRLARSSDQISVGQIIRAVDDKNDALDPNGPDTLNTRDLPIALWSELSRQIGHFLDGISLAEVTTRSAIDQLMAAPKSDGAAHPGYPLS